MARSLLRAEQIRDSDILTEDEHETEISHYYRNLVDVVSYSGHAGEYVVVNTSGTGLTFSSSTSGAVEGLTYGPNLIFSTVSGGVMLNDSSYAFYFGVPSLSGTWRVICLEDSLLFERNNGDLWITMFRLDASILNALNL